MQEGEGLHVRPRRAALEMQGVRVNAVEERGRQPLRDPHVRGAQILGQDRGRCAVRGANVLQARPRRRFLGMVVDDQVHLAQRFLEEARLGVDHHDPVVLGECARLDLLDVDVEDPDHRAVFGAGDGAERRDRGGGPGPPQERAHGERGGDGVRIGIVLHHDQHALGGRQVPADPVHPDAQGSTLHRRRQYPVDEVRGRHRDHRRAVRRRLERIRQHDDRDAGGDPTDGGQDTGGPLGRDEDDDGILRREPGPLIDGVPLEVPGDRRAPAPRDALPRGRRLHDVNRRLTERLTRHEASQRRISAHKNPTHPVEV